MKMVMLIVDADRTEDIEEMFDECDIPGYTQIRNTHGKGSTGKKSGERFPVENLGVTHKFLGKLKTESKSAQCKCA